MAVLTAVLAPLLATTQASAHTHHPSQVTVSGHSNGSPLVVKCPAGYYYYTSTVHNDANVLQTAWPVGNGIGSDGREHAMYFDFEAWAGGTPHPFSVTMVCNRG